MVYLIYQGLNHPWRLKLWSLFVKGRGLHRELEAEMRAKNVPEWYIDSCKKIKYMFPKAHAAAYVLMAFELHSLKCIIRYLLCSILYSTCC